MQPQAEHPFHCSLLRPWWRYSLSHGAASWALRPTNYFAQNWKNFLKGCDESESSIAKTLQPCDSSLPKSHQDPFWFHYFGKEIPDEFCFKLTGKLF